MKQENVTPLTPADCDLREFPFMPLDVVRLRDSDITAISSGDEFRCAVLLWCASWHQVPAASLPDDDIILAQLAGYGRVVKEWKKVREGSLRGWIKSSDGRLYHPVVAEKANEAWDRKLRRSWETECARIKKLNQRHGTVIQYPTLEEFLSPEYTPPKARPVPETSPGTKQQCPEGQHNHVPETSSGKHHRQGDGQGQGQYLKPSTDGDGVPAAGATEQPPPAAVRFAVQIRAWEKARGKVAGIQPSDPRLQAWADAGITDDQLRLAYDLAVDARDVEGDTSPINAGFLDVMVAKVLKPATGQSAVSRVANAPAKPWFMSSTSIEEKAAELGIEKLSGEQWPQWRDRVYAAAGVTAEMIRKAKIDAGERV